MTDYEIANKLIEDIFKFKREYAPELSLVDTIIEYSFKKDIPLQEIGETLNDHSEFMIIFEKIMTKEGYIRNKKNIDIAEIKDNEWG